MAEAVHIAEYERKIAELERKFGQLTMEVDLLRKGGSWDARPNEGSYSIVSGPKPSPSRGCRIMMLARSTYYYRGRRLAAEKKILRDRVEALCAEFPRDGYRRITRQLPPRA
jgi:hypothetical protein